jgi:sulfur carrier protein ThiS
MTMVKLTFRGEEHEVAAGMTLRQAVEKLDLNPHMVLGVCKGKLITDDTVLNDGDEIKLVAVISGG